MKKLLIHILDSKYLLVKQFLTELEVIIEMDSQDYDSTSYQNKIIHVTDWSSEAAGGDYEENKNVSEI